ncbi:acyloxyacyl hydrolase [Tenacibaculum jejuense]|uniref:PagL domain containing protein n=1 Tax=Tenacibaculum jejuense TaxID=584609 RepID=A0A238UGP3_9FLAO|nr:acyloxyacyl hydrolase [Tenacibaculum jejuense]SNR17584.1 PagL domain containing protein [Tenacibaculum jejuense]
MKKSIFLFFLFNLTITTLFSQERKIYLGLNYGRATQNSFPLNDPDYDYDNQYLKVQINYPLTLKENFNFELLIEPSVYFANHQLLNEQFVLPTTENFLELREKFTKRRAFEEYALNIGILIRYNIFSKFSSYLLGSVGPMISNEDTERLKRGFAFSDILGLGFSWKQKRILFDFRLTLRHNSNLNFASPNKGHNSFGIESGISFQL